MPFGSLQKSICPALQQLSFHVEGASKNSSAKRFAKDILTCASQSLESIDLHLSSTYGDLLPDVIMPSLCSLKFGFLDNPLQLKAENFPNLASISFKWLMFQTPEITATLDRMLYVFQNSVVDCVILILCNSGQTFDEQRVTDLIAINHEQQRYNLTFKVFNC